MSENALIVARIIEYNTSGNNCATIDRDHIGVITTQHGRFDGDIDDSIAEALAEQTADRSAADIVGMVDDAAMRAAERDAEAITKDDLLDCR